jgi:hypothetical protein
MHHLPLAALRDRAALLIDFCARHGVFAALLRPTVARAASLPYADKSATASLVYSTALLLHRYAPAAVSLGDAGGRSVSQALNSGSGGGVVGSVMGGGSVMGSGAASGYFASDGGAGMALVFALLDEQAGGCPAAAGVGLMSRCAMLVNLCCIG